MFDLISFIPRAVVQGVPLLYGSTGEILTEKSGNLNLGIPGIMYVGGISGVIGDGAALLPADRYASCESERDWLGHDNFRRGCWQLLRRLTD